MTGLMAVQLSSHLASSELDSFITDKGKCARQCVLCVSITHLIEWGAVSRCHETMASKLAELHSRRYNGCLCLIEFPLSNSHKIFSSHFLQRKEVGERTQQVCGSYRVVYGLAQYYLHCTRMQINVSKHSTDKYNRNSRCGSCEPSRDLFTYKRRTFGMIVDSFLQFARRFYIHNLRYSDMYEYIIIIKS